MNTPPVHSITFTRSPGLIVISHCLLCKLLLLPLMYTSSLVSVNHLFFRVFLFAFIEQTTILKENLVLQDKCLVVFEELLLEKGFDDDVPPMIVHLHCLLLISYPSALLITPSVVASSFSSSA